MLSKIKKHFNFIYFTLFVLIWLFLFWKCRYGYGNSDEAYYLCRPFRILRGDKYLINEWDLSQFSSILLIPAMKLHLMLFGSTTGIILHFRYLFTLIWGLSAIYIFFMLKSISRTGAAISSIMYLIYTPFGIMALSYNSMGIMFLTASLVTLVSKYSEKPIMLTLSGAFFACSVLCCPLLLVIYIIISAITAYHAIRKTNTDLIKKWKYSTLGAVLVFIIFCFIVITPITNQIELLRYIVPNMFIDPAHFNMPFVNKLYYYFNSIFFSNSVSPYVLSAVVIICLLRKFTNISKNILFILICIALIIYQVDFIITNPYLNFMMFAPGILSLFCKIKSDNPSIDRLFYYIQIPGFIYTICIHLSSDQYFYAISSASTVSAVAAFIILVLYCKDIKASSKDKACLVVFSMIIAFLTLQLFSEAYLRYSSVFWEKSMKDQTFKIEVGAEKGLLVTEEKYLYYNALYTDTTDIRESTDINSVLIFSDHLALYLDTNKDLASYSPWTAAPDQTTLYKLISYYSILPDKLPDVIYAPETSEGLSVFKSLGYKEAQSGYNVYMLIKE